MYTKHKTSRADNSSMNIANHRTNITNRYRNTAAKPCPSSLNLANEPCQTSQENLQGRHPNMKTLELKPVALCPPRFGHPPRKCRARLMAPLTESNPFVTEIKIRDRSLIASPQKSYILNSESYIHTSSPTHLHPSHILNLKSYIPSTGPISRFARCCQSTTLTAYSTHITKITYHFPLRAL
jgi:hypothetical protein